MIKAGRLVIFLSNIGAKSMSVFFRKEGTFRENMDVYCERFEVVEVLPPRDESNE